MPAKAVYGVYVIELDDEVYSNARFRNANPDWNPAKPCVYVGSTALTAEERFQQHLAGYKSNAYAHKYGKRLMPRLYRSWQHYPTRPEAERAEEQRALSLRKRGYAVWYGV
ncbi:MAG: GIY-YIG nuclease family protein [Coriobacteriia bacterium]|nr:GIY-YIG nuclease family protein [Coriobacteriia bacterium]